jgi:hypothetical protein
MFMLDFSAVCCLFRGEMLAESFSGSSTQSWAAYSAAVGATDFGKSWQGQATAVALVRTCRSETETNYPSENGTRHALGLRLPVDRYTAKVYSQFPTFFYFRREAALGRTFFSVDTAVKTVQSYASSAEKAMWILLHGNGKECGDLCNRLIADQCLSMEMLTQFSKLPEGGRQAVARGIVQHTMWGLEMGNDFQAVLDKLFSTVTKLGEGAGKAIHSAMSFLYIFHSWKLQKWRDCWYVRWYPQFLHSEYGRTEQYAENLLHQYFASGRVWIDAQRRAADKQKRAADRMGNTVTATPAPRVRSTTPLGILVMSILWDMVKDCFSRLLALILYPFHAIAAAVQAARSKREEGKESEGGEKSTAITLYDEGCGYMETLVWCFDLNGVMRTFCSGNREDISRELERLNGKPGEAAAFLGAMANMDGANVVDVTTDLARTTFVMTNNMWRVGLGNAWRGFLGALLVSDSNQVRAHLPIVGRMLEIADPIGNHNLPPESRRYAENLNLEERKGAIAVDTARMTVNAAKVTVDGGMKIADKERVTAGTLVGTGLGTVGGGAMGAGGGLAIGAVIGSVVPGIGTVVGGLCGALIGGGAAAVTGGAVGAAVGNKVANS